MPRRSLLVGALATALSSLPIHAVELPTPRLDSIFPPGVQAGSQVEVTVAGADLDEAKSLVFSHSGLTAEPKEKRFVIKAAADVPPGIYDVHVEGLLGVSNARAFVVGDLPEKPKAPANNLPTAAAELAIGSTVDGTTTFPASDFYKFQAKAGQRLIVTCQTREIDSKMSPVLAVLDANRREVEIDDHGGVLDFTPQADGEYILQVHDLTFAGGPDNAYRLTLSTGPRIDYVLPPCGQPGTKAKFTLYGRNLPGGVPANVTAADGKPLEKAEVEIDVPAKGDTRADGLLMPAAAAVEGFSYRLKSPVGSNAVFIGFSNRPIAREQEPNDRAEKAQKITPPCEIAGQFFPAGDTDLYAFEAKKGDVWWVEVISNRLDLPTNPFVLVQREQADLGENYGADTNVGGSRFQTASNDPVFRFEAKEDGTYRLKLRDLFGNNRRDPRSVYRLIVRKETPDFALVAVHEPPIEKKDDRTAGPRGALVRVNGTLAIKVLAFRRDGFAGEIELSADGLPAGVVCVPTKIPAGANEGALLLSGAGTPAAWAGTIRVIGKAKVGDHELVHEARGGTVRYAVTDTNLDAARPRLTRDIAIAVSATEQAPMSVQPVDDKRREAAAGGKLEIPLKIARQGEFKEALKLKAFGAPGVEAAKEIDVAANATTATATIDLATAKIPPGEHTLHFEAQTKGKYRGKDVITTVFSGAIPVIINAPAK